MTHRNPVRLSGLRAVGGVVLAVLLSLLMLPALKASAAGPVQVEGGTISWGLKESFRTYIVGNIARGSIVTNAPAVDRDARTVFADASGTWSETSAAVTAAGEVRYAGHKGVLDFSLSNPTIKVDGATARLTVDVRDSFGARHNGLEIATLNLAGSVSQNGTTVTIADAPATLTRAGEVVFIYDGGPMYTAGTPLAPVSATFTVGDEVEVTPTTPTEPTPTDPTPTAPTTPPTPKPTEPVAKPQPKAPLTWGVKESFRKYVEGPIARGKITTSGGVNGGKNTAFVWPWTSASGQQVNFGGSVRFTGHHGELDVVMSSPRVTITSKTTGRLSVDVNGKRIALGDLDLANGKTQKQVTAYQQAPVVLLPSGVSVFAYENGGFYDAGTALDPASFSIAAEVPASSGTAKPNSGGKKPQTKQPQTGGGNVATTANARAGALSWGVKGSFRSYLTGPIAKGTISVSGGAGSTGSAYQFGQNSTTATLPSPVGTTEYRGGVQFKGHHGTLNLNLGQPAVRVSSPTSATLTAQVAGRGRIDLATLNLSAATKSSAAGWLQYANAPATLTAAGSQLFVYNGSSFYPAGTSVDPVTFSIGSTSSTNASSSTVADSAADDDWTPPATAPATTGLRVNQDEVRAGEAITATGTGFQPGETGIKVVVYSTPVVLAEDVTADANGTATWTGTIPATLAEGAHTLTFQGSVNRGKVLEVAPAQQLSGCVLTNGRIDWGFKESFRAYVSGSIANGDWKTAGNAGYETPKFNWVKGAGVRDDKTGAGNLEFTGAVRFTGHDGALDTKVANPMVTFTDAKAAVLSLDYSGSSMDAALAGTSDFKKQQDVPFADLDLVAGTSNRQGDVVTIDDIPATLTAAGSAAFPNYESGAELDPISLTFSVTDECQVGTNPVSSETEETDDSTPAAAVATSASNGPDWLAWVGGAVIGALLACAGTVVVMRRRLSGAMA